MNDRSRSVTYRSWGKFRLPRVGCDSCAAPGTAGSKGGMLDNGRFEDVRVKGIVHTAGVVEDTTLSLQDLAKFERVLKPKVDGA